MSKEVEVILSIDPQVIEDFNYESQEDEDWGNINFPFDANNLTNNTGTHFGSWFQTLEAGQVMKFALDESTYHETLEIEFIRLNPLGSINYIEKSPIEAWGRVVDLDYTEGAIGDYGSYYLAPYRTEIDGRKTTVYKLKGSDNLYDYSPNLSYTILFSFVGKKGNRHYCTIDPLIKTSSKVTD